MLCNKTSPASIRRRMQSDESRGRSSKPDTIGLPPSLGDRRLRPVLPLLCRLVIDPTAPKWPISAVSLINILDAELRRRQLATAASRLSVSGLTTASVVRRRRRRRR